MQDPAACKQRDIGSVHPTQGRAQKRGRHSLRQVKSTEKGLPGHSPHSVMKTTKRQPTTAGLALIGKGYRVRQYTSSAGIAKYAIAMMRSNTSILPALESLHLNCPVADKPNKEKPGGNI